MRVDRQRKRRNIWLLAASPLLFAFIVARAQTTATTGPFALGDSHALPAKLEIVWNAATNDWPSTLPVFVTVKQGFSDTVNREALLMGHFPTRDATTATTQNLIVQDGEDENWTKRINILPLAREIDFEDRSPFPPNPAVPDAAEVSRRAWNAGARFHLPPTDLIEEPDNQRSEIAPSGPAAGKVCYRETVLTRKIGNLEARNFGLTFRLGDRGAVRFFSLRWPPLKRVADAPMATASQIADQLKGRIIAPSVFDETNHSAVPANLLSRAQKLVVTRVTQFYAAVVSPSMRNASRREDYISPFAELRADADAGGTNVTVILFIDIIAAPISVSPGKP